MTLSELRAAYESEIAEATAHLAKAGSLIFDALADMQQAPDLESATYDEAAALLKRSKRTISRLVAAGLLDEIGGRITKKSLREYQEGRRAKDVGGKASSQIRSKRKVQRPVQQRKRGRKIRGAR